MRAATRARCNGCGVFQRSSCRCGDQRFAWKPR